MPVCPPPPVESNRCQAAAELSTGSAGNSNVAVGRISTSSAGVCALVAWAVFVGAVVGVDVAGITGPVGQQAVRNKAGKNNNIGISRILQQKALPRAITESQPTQISQTVPPIGSHFFLN